MKNQILNYMVLRTTLNKTKPAQNFKMYSIYSFPRDKNFNLENIETSNATIIMGDLYAVFPISI